MKRDPFVDAVWRLQSLLHAVGEVKAVWRTTIAHRYRCRRMRITPACLQAKLHLAQALRPHMGPCAPQPPAYAPPAASHASSQPTATPYNCPHRGPPPLPTKL